MPSSKNSVDAASRPRTMSSPGVRPVASMASTRRATASSFEARFGAKPPSSPTGSTGPGRGQDALERVVGLGPPPQGLGERGRPDGQDHELLDVDVVVGVLATVDHVHHRHRQDVGVGPADVAVEGDLELVGRGLGHGQGDPEDGVGPDPGLVVGAVGVDQLPVDVALVEGVEAEQQVGDLTVDEPDGVEDALAAVAVAAVPQLDGLELAGGRPDWERWPGPGRRSRGPPRPRRSGSRGSRGPHGPRRG